MSRGGSTVAGALGALWRRRFAIGCVVMAVVILVPVAACYVALRASVPRVDGRIRVAGLQASAEVVRDRFGVPSIVANSDLDASFALGFVHAQDRFFQMEVQRRAARGRLSALVGRPTLALDQKMRGLGLERSAERSLGALQPHTRALLDAYSAGVNAWLVSQPRHRSAELDLLAVRLGSTILGPWTPIDSILLLKQLSLTFEGGYALELARAALLESVGADAVAVLLDAEVPGTFPIVGGAEDRSPVPGGGPLGAAPRAEKALLEVMRLRQSLGAGVGGTCWAVAGSRTRSGKPILANEMHMPVRRPAQWYEVRLTGGDLDAAGMTMPGLPFVLAGKNRHIAWGITPMNADVQDLVVETLVANDRDHYVVAGETLAFDRRQETIDIAGEAAVAIEVRGTVHGPIVDDNSRNRGPMALRWTALAEDDTSMDALVALNRAVDWESFRAALHPLVVPVMTFAYADDAGHIGLLGAGRIPIRVHGDGSVPTPATARDPWSGFIPFDELPGVFDPADGFIVSASQRVTDSTYPYHLGSDWPPASRAIRLRELLKDRRDLTLDDVASMQGDVASVEARLLRPLLLATHAEGDVQRAALSALEQWDAVLRAESGVALLYEAWKHKLVHAIFVDDAGEDLLTFVPTAALIDVLARNDARYCDDRRTPTEETCADMLSSTLTAALVMLDKRFGPLPYWRLDHGLFVRFRSVEFSWLPVIGSLFTDSRPGRGDESTLRFFATSYDLSASIVSAAVASYDLGTGEVRAGLTLGQSAHALSPHFDDMLPSWETDQPPRVEPAEAAARARLQLVP